MAKYTYVGVSKAHNAASWIQQLQRISPISQASAHHTEIHFTQPKAALPQAALRPHVTFISSNGTTHWYLKNAGGKYAVELGGAVEPQPNEAGIAADVVADAVLLNWINPAAPAKLVDESGFQVQESRGKRRGRMQTGWQ